MKKKYVLMFAAGLVLLMTACNKKEAEGQSVSQEKDAVVTYIKATAKENATKASIDDSTGDFTWNTGDRIAVWADGYKISDGLADTYDGTNAATFSFTGLDESKRANFAIYPADFANSTYYTDTDLQVNLPSSYTLAQVRDNVSPLPMIATNAEDGTLSFKQLCALLRVTVNNIPPSAKRLELNFHDNKVHGSFTAALEEGRVKPAISTIATEGSSANDIITITKDGTDVTLNSGSWLDNLVLNIPIPVGTYTKVTVTAYDALTSGSAILTMTRPIKVSADWTATRANARKCTASLPAFSVSNSKRVHIAKSNLQLSRPDMDKTWAEYQAEGKLTWSFMPNSWSRDTDTDIELDYGNKQYARSFAWGSTGHNFNAGKDPEEYVYGTYYQPWNTAYKEERQGSDFGPKGSSTSLTGDFALGDWGKKICEGGKTLDDGYGASSQWRLLTGEESLYLFGKTENPTFGTSSVTTTGDAEEGTVCYEKRHNRWGMCRINTDTTPVIGVFFVPDYFVNPTTVSVTGGAFRQEYNQFSAAQWTLMEAAGAAFLPASTRILRVANTERGISSNPNISYWTSTGRGDNTTHATAIDAGGHLESLCKVAPASTACNRRNGMPIRLIRDLN